MASTTDGKDEGLVESPPVTLSLVLHVLRASIVVFLEVVTDSACIKVCNPQLLGRKMRTRLGQKKKGQIECDQWAAITVI